MNTEYYWRGYMPGASEEQPDVFLEPYPGWSPRPDGSWGGYVKVVGPFDTHESVWRIRRCPIYPEICSTGLYKHANQTAAADFDDVFCELCGGSREQEEEASGGDREH